MNETIGQRIARLRQAAGYTQQSLAARLAISRVAVSQIELDLTLPSERTVTLLAGLFKLSPPALVAGTTYPQAKADRLPPTACAYTPLELDLALLANDLAWLDKLDDRSSGANGAQQIAVEIAQKWIARLQTWQDQPLEEAEQARLQQALGDIQLTTKGTKETK